MTVSRVSLHQVRGDQGVERLAEGVTAQAELVGQRDEAAASRRRQLSDDRERPPVARESQY
jgi:hypothetical protein